MQVRSLRKQSSREGKRKVRGSEATEKASTKSKGAKRQGMRVQSSNPEGVKRLSSPAGLAWRGTKWLTRLVYLLKERLYQIISWLMPWTDYRLLISQSVGQCSRSQKLKSWKNKVKIIKSKHNYFTQTELPLFNTSKHKIKSSLDSQWNRKIKILNMKLPVKKFGPHNLFWSYDSACEWQFLKVSHFKKIYENEFEKS